MRSPRRVAPTLALAVPLLLAASSVVTIAAPGSAPLPEDLALTTPSAPFERHFVLDEIVVRGTTRTSSTVVENALELSAGDSVDPARILEAVEALRATEIFESVTFHTERGEERGHVRLLLYVEERGVEGLGILAHNYEGHAITEGLNRNRITYFPGARPLLLRLPSSEDDVRRIVLSSHRSWVSEDLSWLERSSGRPEPGAAQPNYQVLVAAGRYPRGGGEARIVVFGDAELASNRYLRALYNLDLVLNAVHWAAGQEPEITQRPKIRQTVQFPVPLNNSVRALYGVGLLLPELLLIAGGIVWLRRRSA